MYNTERRVSRLEDGIRRLRVNDPTYSRVDYPFARYLRMSSSEARNFAEALERNTVVRDLLLCSHTLREAKASDKDHNTDTPALQRINHFLRHNGELAKLTLDIYERTSSIWTTVLRGVAPMCAVEELVLTGQGALRCNPQSHQRQRQRQRDHQRQQRNHHNHRRVAGLLPPLVVVDPHHPPPVNIRMPVPPPAATTARRPVRTATARPQHQSYSDSPSFDRSFSPAMADLIAKSANLKTLVLRDLALGSPDMRLISQAVARNRTGQLTRVEFRNVQRRNTGAPYLYQYLLHGLIHHPTIAHISFQASDLTSSEQEELWYALLGHSSNAGSSLPSALQTLELQIPLGYSLTGPSAMKISTESMRRLTSVLSRQQVPTTPTLSTSSGLTALSVIRIWLRGEKARMLGCMLETNTCMQKLDLTATALTSPDVSVIAQGMRKNIALKTLILRENSIDGSHESFHVVGDMLAENETLQCLDLHGNLIGGDGLAMIAQGLKQNATLHELVLSRQNRPEPAFNNEQDRFQYLLNTVLSSDPHSSGMDAHGVAALAEALSAPDSRCALKRLDFRCNNLGDLGGTHLAQALPTNQSLEELDLSCNGLGTNSLAAFARALVDNTTLQVLRLDKNKHLVVEPPQNNTTNNENINENVNDDENHHNNPDIDNNHNNGENNHISDAHADNNILANNEGLEAFFNNLPRMRGLKRIFFTVTSKMERPVTILLGGALKHNCVLEEMSYSDMDANARFYLELNRRGRRLLVAPNSHDHGQQLTLPLAFWPTILAGVSRQPSDVSYLHYFLTQNTELLATVGRGQSGNAAAVNTSNRSTASRSRGGRRAKSVSSIDSATNTIKGGRKCGKRKREN